MTTVSYLLGCYTDTDIYCNQFSIDCLHIVIFNQLEPIGRSRGWRLVIIFDHYTIKFNNIGDSLYFQQKCFHFTQVKTVWNFITKLEQNWDNFVKRVVTVVWY